MRSSGFPVCTGIDLIQDDAPDLARGFPRVYGDSLKKSHVVICICKVLKPYVTTHRIKKVVYGRSQGKNKPRCEIILQRDFCEA